MSAFCRSVDPSEAVHIPGVRTYIGADDVPGSNRALAVVCDEELFATEKVILLNKCFYHMAESCYMDQNLHRKRSFRSSKSLYLGTKV